MVSKDSPEWMHEAIIIPGTTIRPARRRSIRDFRNNSATPEVIPEENMQRQSSFLRDSHESDINPSAGDRCDESAIVPRRWNMD